ncbi:MAG: hypothetical protein ABI634_15505 [Acidobacteriota bacterium]
MKRLILIVCMALGATVVARAQEKPPALVAGTWRMTMEMAMGAASPEITLKQEGEKLTGTYSGRYGTFTLAGKVRGRLFEFSFAMNEPHPVSMCFQGEISADGASLEGTAVLAELGDATWTAKKDETPKK